MSMDDDDRRTIDAERREDAALWFVRLLGRWGRWPRTSDEGAPEDGGPRD